MLFGGTSELFKKEVTAIWMKQNPQNNITRYQIGALPDLIGIKLFQCVLE
jgi:hypothetical protein